MDKETFFSSRKALVRSHLEYASTVWSPHGIGKIEELDKVQKGQQNWFMTRDNKNLAIANRSRVSFAHNTLRASIGINITP